MENYQKAFIELAIEQKVLRFGEFTLKSGRTSPYFFNAGQFQDGSSIAALGRFYAQALTHANVNIDMLFGPAYKGIPLVTATGIALADNHQQNYPICYNRKEAKSHGEGGVLVGAPLNGKVAIIDDVITAGTAVREVIGMIQASQQATLGAVIVGLDRQERGTGNHSAIQEIEEQFNVPVISIVKLDDIIQFLQEQGQADNIQAMENYREQYGIS